MLAFTLTATEIVISAAVAGSIGLVVFFLFLPLDHYIEPPALPEYPAESGVRYPQSHVSVHRIEEDSEDSV